MTVMDAPILQELTIRKIDTNDDELNTFLFSLGCYSGETITVINKQKSGCVVAIKDSRYHIDKKLASAILV